MSMRLSLKRQLKQLKNFSLKTYAMTPSVSWHILKAVQLQKWQLSSVFSLPICKFWRSSRKKTALLVYIFKVKVPKSELFEKLLTFNPSVEAIWSIRGSYTFLHVGVVPNDKNCITFTANLQEHKFYLHPVFIWLVSFTGGVKYEQKYSNVDAVIG